MDWQRVEGNDMFERANAKFHAPGREMIWSSAMAFFLRHSSQGWQDAPDQYHFFLPSEDTPRHPEVTACHCYYHGLGTAGVVEFRRVFDGEVWLEETFDWKVINERNGPALDRRGLPIEILSKLWNPAPNNTAARWRWVNWHARGEQMPIYRGMGVTYDNGRDRTPYIVVECDPKLKGIAVAPVEWKVVKGSEQDGSAVYEFGDRAVGNQSWEIRPSRKKADQGKHLYRFQGGYGTYTVGYMDASRDPHF